MRLFDYEILCKDINCSKKNNKLLEELLEKGKECINENGINLIRNIMITRGLSEKEIANGCGISLRIIEAIMRGDKKITKGLSEKLGGGLGFPSNIFLNKGNDK